MTDQPLLRTFIANFGRENHLWPRCRDQEMVLTISDADHYPFWLSGDREGYIAHAIAHKKSAAGLTPTRPVAARWFNLATTVSETSGDLWIHREKDELWWTVSKSDPIQISLEKSGDSRRQTDEVYVCQKPSNPWSNRTKKGARLVWPALHPKAREFLFTEGTLQQLSPDNAAYAQASIGGDDLSPRENQIA